jgi:hypothetical protein
VTDPDHRHDLLEGALKRWRGPAFDDVTGEPLAEAHKVWSAGSRRTSS